MKAALMIIDLQRAYYRGFAEKAMDAAAEYVNAAIPLFRQRGLPIIWVQHTEPEDKVVPGEVGFDFIDSLKPEAGDYRIVKEYGNAFNKTDCVKIFRDAGIDTAILTGYCAEQCVLSTYRGAQDLDLLPVILRNALAGDNAENITFVENISMIISFGVLKRVLKD